MRRSSVVIAVLAVVAVHRPIGQVNSAFTAEDMLKVATARCSISPKMAAGWPSPSERSKVMPRQIIAALAIQPTSRRRSST